MIPLMFFRGSEEKKERERVTREEIDRFASLPPEKLELEVLLVLASDGVKEGPARGVRMLEIVKHLVESAGGSFGAAARPLFFPTQEALQRLEHASLVLGSASTGAGMDSTRWRITTSGEQALADGDVATKVAGRE
jgi:hypothetical protein